MGKTHANQNQENMSISQTPKNGLSKAMEEELRKQGINPDMISEYGDVDFEDHIDDNLTYNDNFDEYGDDSYEY